MFFLKTNQKSNLHNTTIFIRWRKLMCDVFPTTAFPPPPKEKKKKKSLKSFWNILSKNILFTSSNAQDDFKNYFKVVSKKC